jgi:hypothetical protein
LKKLVDEAAQSTHAVELEARALGHQSAARWRYFLIVARCSRAFWIG